MTRHHFLAETIGTRPEEDDSYENIITLIVVSAAGVFFGSFLEMIFYFLYNMKVWLEYYFRLQGILWLFL